ncbi:hypothetical protein QTJ16_000844 [Diplocarpon rosae]|uniref:Uncharacterized protein n=1 Tax=Diplocarpon rosae TaxID=946125 RepID=A0AAD9T7E0_9HELO|nr:hypothetical protein QTJ16_000844 [Diplocarpon rosae]
MISLQGAAFQASPSIHTMCSLVSGRHRPGADEAKPRPIFRTCAPDLLCCIIHPVSSAPSQPHFDAPAYHPAPTICRKEVEVVLQKKRKRSATPENVKGCSHARMVANK